MPSQTVAKKVRAKRVPTGAAKKKLAAKLVDHEGRKMRLAELAIEARYDPFTPISEERRILVELEKFDERDLWSTVDQMDERLTQLESLTQSAGDDAQREDVAPPLCYPPSETAH